MKNHILSRSALFVLSCTLACTGVSQARTVSTDKHVQTGAQELNVKDLAIKAVNDLNISLSDCFCLLRFVRNNPSLISKLPVLVDKIDQTLQATHTIPTHCACASTDELIKTVQNPSMTQNISQILTLVAQACQHMIYITDTLTAVADAIQNNKLLTNNNQHIVKHIITQTFTPTEITNLTNLLKTDNIKRICDAIIANPQVITTLVQKILQKYRDVVITAQDKIIEVKTYLDAQSA